jgi:hypothetical protein
MKRITLILCAALLLALPAVGQTLRLRGGGQYGWSTSDQAAPRILLSYNAHADEWRNEHGRLLSWHDALWTARLFDALWGTRWGPQAERIIRRPRAVMRRVSMQDAGCSLESTKFFISEGGCYVSGETYLCSPGNFPYEECVTTVWCGFGGHGSIDDDPSTIIDPGPC